MFIYKDESFMVLHVGEHTLVNANDALHASSRHVIDHFCELIRSGHPQIDTLMLGYGGAAWFPNCLQITDDVGYDAMAREHVFAENFAYIARKLEARMALPFAASFALLEEQLGWINDAKWRSPSPCEELLHQGGLDIRTHFLMPGDRILDGHIRSAGGQRPTAEEAEVDLQKQFALQIAALQQRHAPDEPRLGRILAALQANAASRARRVLRPGQHLLCRIDLRDIPEASFMTDCTSERARVERCDRLRLAPMVLTTRLAVLEAWATQEYGFEAISIGYGGVLALRRRDLPLRNALLALLGRKPLPATRFERILAWARSPRRSFDTWRRDLHWEVLSLKLRRGQVQRFNDIYSTDPERWSPLRDAPLPAAPEKRAALS
jgi:hypothetical protein